MQAAHVGVGISGVEGLQAASASDYAIAQVTQHYDSITSTVNPCTNHKNIQPLISPFIPGIEMSGFLRKRKLHPLAPLRSISEL